MASKRPDYFRGGKLATKLNAWVDFLMDFYHAGIGLTETNSPTGRSFNSVVSSILKLLAHNYTVYNRSTGATPAIGVKIGSHTDFTSGSVTWIPTLGGTPLDENPDPFTVGDSDTRVYFKITVNELDGSGTTPPGQITAIEVNSGTAVPASDNTHIYQLIAVIQVTITDGVAFVTNKEGGVSGSQGYAAVRNWFSSSYASLVAIWGI